MSAYFALPFIFLQFWFVEAPLGLLRYFSSLNTAFLHLFSLPLLLRTFFKPLKNEYRQGLVGFSIGMGIVIKSCLIFIDLLFFLMLLVLEIAFLGLFLLIPIFAILLLIPSL
jgi:hypothetical protein